jgi:hypothetical protein
MLGKLAEQESGGRPPSIAAWTAAVCWPTSCWTSSTCFPVSCSKAAMLSPTAAFCLRVKGLLPPHDEVGGLRPEEAPGQSLRRERRLEHAW